MVDNFLHGNYLNMEFQSICQIFCLKTLIRPGLVDIFTTSIWEAEAGEFQVLRPAWST